MTPPDLVIARLRIGSFLGISVVFKTLVHHTSKGFFAMEAATGFEPVMEVLQTSALPLGYAASVSILL